MPVQLTIVTPEGEKYSGEVESIVLPGSEGDFGVLERHERFLTPLRIGAIEIATTDGQTVFGAIADGFADVSAEQVTVMVESCEASDEIDAARAELAKTRAEQALAQVGASEDEARMDQYEAALERAINRLGVANRGRG